MRSNLLLAAVLATVLAGGCNTPGMPVNIPILTGPRLSDEQVIVAVLEDVQRGMEERRIYKVLAHVSRNYQDAEGRNYKDIEDYLARVFELYREIRVTRVTPQVYVQGYEAKAIETFGTQAEPFDASKAPPLQLQGQLVVYLEKVDNRWLIVEWDNVQ